MFRFRETLSGEEASKQDKIEAKFKKFCKDVKSKENRFCYYLGGTEDAATGWAKNAWAKVPVLSLSFSEINFRPYDSSKRQFFIQFGNVVDPK